MRPASLPDLVELIYAASCDPAGWRPMLDALYQTVGGCGANFVAMSREHERSTVHTGVGTVDQAFECGYQGAVALGDPYYIRGMELGLFREGVVAVAQSLVPYDAYRKSAFFNEFGRRHQYFGGMSAVVASTPTANAVVTVMAGEHHPFGSDETRLMQALLPHFRRALQVQARFDGAAARERGLEAALDAMATGAVVVDARGTVLFANASARATIEAGDGLRAYRGELRAVRSHDTTTLRRMIRGVTRAPEHAGSGGVVWLERPAGPALHVVVAPVPPVDSPLSPGRAALVFITAQARRQIDADLIRRVHGLSPAEVKVAQCLLQGQSVDEASGSLGISVNTVRFHLRNLFAKTGTRRQGDLIRVLLGTAQVVAQPPSA